MDGIIEEPPQWLENPAWNGFRVWHILFLGCGALLSLIVMICCCFRFRIPRTKQEIEADFQRRKITKKFKKKLANIQNSEMDDMDLKKGALERVRQEFLEDAVENGKLGEEKKLLENELNSNVQAALDSLKK
uniref:CSON012742 protein n=1 Tax=Culicoides sonorensis TaxID=179676 RepID=A0A336M6B0_CULSO